MRIWPECIPCIYNARAREILASTLGPDEKIRALAKLHDFLSRTPVHASTIRLASAAFRLVKLLTHNPDPYSRYKEESNEYVRREVLPVIEKSIGGLKGYERFRRLALASININVLDPGVPGYGKLEVVLDDDLEVDETREAFRLIQEASYIVYILDNAGEALVDLLFVRELSEMGKEVVVMAKSLPYQNDVTVEEAVRIGFSRFAEIMGTGSDCGGLLPGEISDAALDILKRCDVAIAKGMAAYESMIEWEVPCRVIHLLKAKCQPVAASIGVKVGGGVVKILGGRGSS